MVGRIFSSCTNKETKLSSTVKTDGVTGGTTLVGLHGRLYMRLRGEWVKKVVRRVMSFFPMLVFCLMESQVNGRKKGRDQV